MIVPLLVTVSLLGFVLAASVWVDAATTRDPATGDRPIPLSTPDRSR
jgi:hypothetical protein